MIDPVAVDTAFRDSLFHDDELVDGKPIDPVVVEGITANFGFKRNRLETHRAEVASWLDQLPTQFKRTGGGGWSFLNACMDRDDRQWTGEHSRMEQLLTLGIGLGLAKWQMPRDLWAVLPGGMPYVVVEG